MKHTVRINGEVKEIDCELGSGILDKNGREIFEGDIVKRHNDIFTVIYRDAMLRYFINENKENEWALALWHDGDLEIIGHVND